MRQLTLNNIDVAGDEPTQSETQGKVFHILCATAFMDEVGSNISSDDERIRCKASMSYSISR